MGWTAWVNLLLHLILALVIGFAVCRSEQNDPSPRSKEKNDRE